MEQKEFQILQGFPTHRKLTADAPGQLVVRYVQQLQVGKLVKDPGRNSASNVGVVEVQFPEVGEGADFVRDYNVVAAVVWDIATECQCLETSLSSDVSFAVGSVLTTQGQLVIGKIKDLQMSQCFTHPRIERTYIPRQVIPAQIQMSQVHKI